MNSVEFESLRVMTESGDDRSLTLGQQSIPIKEIKSEVKKKVPKSVGFASDVRQSQNSNIRKTHYPDQNATFDDGHDIEPVIEETAEPDAEQFQIHDVDSPAFQEKVKEEASKIK